MRPNAVIRFSKFEPNAHGHGGHKRTVQILELLDSAQLHVIDFERTNDKKSVLHKLKFLLKALKIIIKFKRFYGLISSFKEARLIGHHLYSLETLLAKHKTKYEIKTFIWEYTWSSYWYIPLIARRLGLKIVVIPHNLESLVYSQRSHKPKKVLSPLWLDEEIEYLDYANKIFCISREEQWLLSLHINPNKVHYLPYNPPKASLDFLMDVRSEREKQEQQAIVTVLGSAVNPPTLKGMKDLKKHLLEHNNKELLFDFVGYGVNWVKEDHEILPENIIMSESISDAELREKLIKTSCVLVHQIPSSGALTKIQEMQIAGIPVLVNSMGARSYYNLEGVYVYETFSDLEVYLHDLTALKPPSLPEVKPIFETTFIECLIR